ncbi:MAG: cytochrome b/b6 domain-containing protein [Cocleimonas sp.]|nr:cytochrome b/b6 domain-containing protein [Cocleimonas sp.]
MKYTLYRVIVAVLLAGLSSFANATAPAPLIDAHQTADKLLPGEVKLNKSQMKDSNCLDCHGQKGFAVPLGKHGEPPYRSLHVNGYLLSTSVHGEYTCNDCHTDIEKLPHKKQLEKVDCVACHLSQGKATAPERTRWLTDDSLNIVIQTKRYSHSIHAVTKGADNNASCADCHTAHYVFNSKDTRSTSHKLNAPETCGNCHAKTLKEYQQSIHGAYRKTPWKGDSATCTDCHSAHQIGKNGTVVANRVITEQCGICHSKESRSYKATTHGQLAWLGNKDVAQCKDCHNPHSTHKIDHAASLVSKQNILNTCQTCHKEAGEDFVNFRAHADVGDFERNPELWFMAKIMIAIIIITLIFFYTHSMLWFWREMKSRPYKWVTVDNKRFKVRAKRVKHDSGKHFRRFSWQWRVNHWLLALSVMTLTLTGMVVMFPQAPWAVFTIDHLGGTAGFGYVHRTAAVVFLLAVFGHAAVVVYRLRKNKAFDWFGPDSLLPRWKDWADMKGQFKWFFGKGEAPRFDRWAYWEKFDYWAVYWGALVIGLSGLILWFSPFFSRFLPGWVFNLSTLAHGLEAFLAVMTLFVVHFFNNHFRPSKFPLDTVMFIGSWDLEEFKEERPEEYERLKASGELEKRIVAPPSKRVKTVSYILGFTLLGIGLILLTLVIIGFFQRGLV